MNAFLAVLGLSGPELILVLVVILVLFGAKKIPEFAKGLGKGINEFKKASREVTDEIERSVEEPPPAAKPAPRPPENQTVAQSPTRPKACGFCASAFDMADPTQEPRLDDFEEDGGGPVKSFLEHLEDLR